MNLSTLAATQKECAKLREERDDLQRTFNVMWASQMRAIQAWQERHDEPMTWPDHERLVDWLLEERGKLRTAVDHAAACIADMLMDDDGRAYKAAGAALPDILAALKGAKP